MTPDVSMDGSPTLDGRPVQWSFRLSATCRSQVRSEFPIPLGRPFRPSPLLIAVAVLFATGTAAAAQDPDTLPVQAPPLQDAVQVPEVDPGVSPGGAFLRALVLPGWGHAAIGSYTRGGFYFAAESATAWMLLRTVRRRSAAEDVRDLREATVRERLRARGITDPAEVAAAIREDEAANDARKLVDARSQQFEDWLALGVFLVFLSGADAYVSAHLQDFPEPVQVGFGPVPGGFEVGLRIPTGLLFR